jgi:hypothetical protein
VQNDPPLPWKTWQSFEAQSEFCWQVAPKAPAPPASPPPLPPPLLLLAPASSSPPELDPPLPDPLLDPLAPLLLEPPPELLPLTPLLVPPLDEPEPDEPSCPPLPPELPPEPDEEDVVWRTAFGSPTPGSGALHPTEKTPSIDTRPTGKAARMARAIAPAAPRVPRTRRLDEFTTTLRAPASRAPLSHGCDANLRSRRCFDPASLSWWRDDPASNRCRDEPLHRNRPRKPLSARGWVSTGCHTDAAHGHCSPDPTMKLRSAFVWAAGATLLPFAFAVGCSSGSGSGASCSAGETRACSCSGSGGTGTETCGAGGTYGACSCGDQDGSTDGDTETCDGSHGQGCGDGGGLQDVGSWMPSCPDAGSLGFACACTQGTNCQSGDCFDFSAKGHFCTKPCAMTSDCPNPPDLGCNGMGQCKVP